MRLWWLTWSDMASLAVGFILVGTMAIILYQYLGWLGVGFVGLFALVISTRLGLQGGRALPGAHMGTSTVNIYARQLREENRQPSPEEKLAAAARDEKRSRILSLANTFLIALTALGFGLFFLHQL